MAAVAAGQWRSNVNPLPYLGYIPQIKGFVGKKDLHIV